MQATHTQNTRLLIQAFHIFAHRTNIFEGPSNVKFILADRINIFAYRTNLFEGPSSMKFILADRTNIFEHRTNIFEHVTNDLCM